MKNVICLLKSAAEKYPDRVAFEGEHSSYTYAEALSATKRIASFLKDKGVRRQGILVPVNAEAETILLFLGVAASGNYYIPLDVTAGTEKIEKILHESGSQFLLSPSENHLDLLPSASFAETQTAKECPFEEEDWEETSPLYLMFTSGSTGRPKGVLKSHKNILSYVDSFRQSFPELQEEILANQTPFSFDASAKDIYLSLAMGGSLYIPPRTLFVLPAKLMDYLNERKVSMISWVPSALTVVAKLKTFSFVKPTTLKYVFFVGEPFVPKYLNYWIEALPNVQFTNLYGSTELAGVALAYRLDGPVPDDAIVPIGKPIANNEAWLEEDEILIVSDQVALGYTNDPERNATTFEHRDGKTVLHTGDYGHLDEQGNIVFSSRKDYQIKHMGYRIELQEIEIALSSLPYVANSCCLYDKKNAKICLFVTLSEPIENPQRRILADAKARLAAYMVPNKIFLLEQMPLNANGKIDRQRLEKSLEQ